MPTTQSQSSYQDLQAKYETQETPESIILHVHIPDGFKREDIGAKIEYDLGRVRVHGDRSLGNNKRARFNVLYEVPEYCDINKIRGKYDGKSVTITIATIPEKVPTKQKPQETEPSQEEGAPTHDDQDKTVASDQVPKEEATPPKATQESMHQKGQEGVPQNATTTKVENEKQVGDHETSATPKDTQESKPQKGQEEIPPKDQVTKVESEKQVGDHETSATPKDTQESKPQKGQEEIPPKDQVTKVESEKQVGDHETSATPKDTQESKSQKGQEEIPPKDEITKVESKKQVDHEASSSTPPEETVESMPQKGQEAITPKATLAKDAKLQAEEKFEGETVDENEENQKVIGKNETEDHLESGKSHEKGVVDDSSATKKEGKEESKGLDTYEGEKGRERNGKIVNDGVEKKSENKKDIHESTTRTRIKEVAASASQAMTSLVKRFNDEDNQKIIYMGAAVLVVALGVYATYKLRSRRP
ncbi:protein RESTRICTED TEV MOVEMENT 2 [Cajanus cajan]|uniref:protein RESTRICTED TEV MOVEMENT 2 n=1 Tax=Cajanus cajan TaxID=3821 RepID=UPI00098DCABB|nr:protein RESTRICTED TEV MOVEMENT 2 [Cajanus cajan]